jgi:hypothetical protein
VLGRVRSTVHSAVQKCSVESKEMEFPAFGPFLELGLEQVLKLQNMAEVKRS